MKRHALAVLMLLFFFLTSEIYSQSKYGNVTMDEMTMETYFPDTTAAAVMLLKYGDTRFVLNTNKGFQFETVIETKIKILKSEGLEWCDQQISFYEESNSRKEEIRGLSGMTYNLEDGKIVKTKLSKDHIFEEETDKKWKVKKFTMPAAKVGSVIEFKYTLISDFFWVLRDFTFQASIPIVFCKYDITIPEYFVFNTNFQGYISLDTKRQPVNESFHLPHRDDHGNYQSQVRCTAEQTISIGKNVPALKNESYLWTINDYISKVSFELKRIQFPYSTVKNFSNTWDDVDKGFMESGYFGGNLKKADLFKNEISKTDITLDKAKEIQDMVKYRVKWNDKNAVGTKDLKNALKDGIGNCADVNFLLINALKAGGFEAYPVLLSTRSNGRLPFHPTEDAFNYVITAVKIDTTMYYTDAASKYGDWNLLPTKCMVPQGRVMTSSGRPYWVDLSTLTPSSSLRVSQCEFTGTQFKAAVTETLKGSISNSVRTTYSSAKDENEFLESMSKRLGADIGDFKVTNLDDTGNPLVFNYIQSSDLSLDDDIIYLNPLTEKLFSSNPFKEEAREYPIQFNYLLNYVQIADITVPDGYVIDEVPKSEKIVFNDNDIALTYRITKTDKLIRVYYQYQLKKLLFLPQEYDNVKEFFSKLILKNSEMIVLKKTTANEPVAENQSEL